MKNIKVIKVLMQTCLGLRYGYVQQITLKSIVIIKSENETEVFNRKTGRPRPEPKLQSAKDNQPKILSLPAIEEFIASRARIERDLNPRFNSKFNSRNKRKLINHELVDDKFDGHNIQKCFNCWHGNWMPDSNEKVTLLSARYFKHDIHLYEYAVVNNSIQYPDGTKGNGYDYERWFLAQGVEIIDLSK